MRDLEAGTAHGEAETLTLGAAGGSPDRTRLVAVAVLCLALGAVAGGFGALWWEARPEPAAPPADEHAVELLLFAAEPRGRGADRVLRVDGALLMSGRSTSTVQSVDPPHDSFVVRAPALPVTVSPAARYQPLDLLVTVRDCSGASRWTPVERPFTITWRDEHGKVHLDRAGDFDRSVAAAMTGYVDAVCDAPVSR